MKRILIIVGILIAAVAIVTIGMLLRGSTTPPAGPTGSLPDGATLPIAGNNGNGNGTTDGGNGAISGPSAGPDGSLPVGGIGAVAQAAVIDYAVTSQGVSFLASNGAVFTPSSSEAVAQANFGDILGAHFSPDGKWLLVESGDNELSNWNLLDVGKKTWRSLPVNTSQMVWSPNGGQLAYLARRTNGDTLSVYTPATGAIKPLLGVFAPDLNLQWKDATHIFMLDKPSSLVPGPVLELNLTNSALKVFANNVSGAELLWGGARSGGLLFKAAPTGGTLSVVDSNGNTAQSASFLTLPSKCAFGESAATSSIQNISDYLFCGIPQDQQTIKERRLPDDYFKGEFATADTLYAVSLMTGQLVPLLQAAQTFGFDAANMKVHGENLYFVNRNDRKLYKVSLSALAGPAAGE